MLAAEKGMYAEPTSLAHSVNRSLFTLIPTVLSDVVPMAMTHAVTHGGPLYQRLRLAEIDVKAWVLSIAALAFHNNWTNSITAAAADAATKYQKRRGMADASRSDRFLVSKFIVALRSRSLLSAVANASMEEGVADGADPRPGTAKTPAAATSSEFQRQQTAATWFLQCAVRFWAAELKASMDHLPVDKAAVTSGSGGGGRHGVADPRDKPSIVLEEISCSCTSFAAILSDRHWRRYLWFPSGGYRAEAMEGEVFGPIVTQFTTHLSHYLVQLRPSILKKAFPGPSLHGNASSASAADLTWLFNVWELCVMLAEETLSAPDVPPTDDASTRKLYGSLFLDVLPCVWEWTAMASLLTPMCVGLLLSILLAMARMSLLLHRYHPTLRLPGDRAPRQLISHRAVQWVGEVGLPLLQHPSVFVAMVCPPLQSQCWC